ncbi:amidohydrolase family protein [Francisellaceae bacterium]|nr:amidohydrolase family protein [Francisellaceae bacterium]
MSIKMTLPKWYDLHVHLRQDELLPIVIADHIKSGCAGVLAMPNTKPPVAKILESDSGDFWSIEAYQRMIDDAGGDAFQKVIVPLYLTKETTVEMVEKGVESKFLVACKYYPPHGTTNADHGRELKYFIDNGVFAKMAELGVVLCIHGEEHDLDTEDYFDRSHNAEELFYQTKMPALHNQFPDLKIVCEHLTTKVAVDFVKASNENVSATVTPQHLLYTISDLVKGLKYHLYCLPLLKFKEDREALRKAVTESSNTKFFAGTDSAPHSKKVTECGCAAGCYTAPIAPQLYAGAFECSGIDLSAGCGQDSFRKFLCEIGPRFYNFPISLESFVLKKEEIKVFPGLVGGVGDKNHLIPLPLGLSEDASSAYLNWKVL